MMIRDFEPNPIYVKDGTPTERGLYVVYTDSLVGPQFTDRLLLTWFDERWCYPGSDGFFKRHVYGWVGPLPFMRLELDGKPLVSTVETKKGD